MTNKKVMVILPQNDYQIAGRVVNCCPTVFRKYSIKNGVVCVLHRGEYREIIELENFGKWSSYGIK